MGRAVKEKLKFVSSVDTYENEQLPMLLLGKLSHSETVTYDRHSVRASRLYDSCIRELALGAIIGRKKRRNLSLADRLTFDIGDIVHNIIRNNPDYLGSRLAGWWKCPSCGWRSDFQWSKPEGCKKCDARWLVYSETQLTVPGLTGHPDGYLGFDNSFVRPVELKSIKDDFFNRLYGPLAENEFQLNVYMYLGEKSTVIPVPVDWSIGYLVYICKQHTGAKLPIKIFKVVRNKDLTKTIKDRVAGFLKATTSMGRQDIQRDLLPALHADCSLVKWKSGRAKFCPMIGECKEYQ